MPLCSFPRDRRFSGTLPALRGLAEQEQLPHRRHLGAGLQAVGVDATGQLVPGVVPPVPLRRLSEVVPNTCAGIGAQSRAWGQIEHRNHFEEDLHGMSRKVVGDSA